MEWASIDIAASDGGSSKREDDIELITTERKREVRGRIARGASRGIVLGTLGKTGEDVDDVENLSCAGLDCANVEDETSVDIYLEWAKTNLALPATRRGV